MSVDLGLDELALGVSKKFLSGFRDRVERVLDAATHPATGPFNDAATATAQQSQALQPGQVVAYAGLTAPTGFLECSGAEVSKSQYPDLANVLGTRFGTAAAGKFKLPNAEEAAIMGAGGTRVAGVQTAAGSRYEGNTTSLTIAHLPEHDHVIDTISSEDPGHVHSLEAYPRFGIKVPDNWVTGTGGGSGAGIETDGSGTFGQEPYSPIQYDYGDAGIDQNSGGGFWSSFRDAVTSIFTREEKTETTDDQRNRRTSSYRRVEFGPNAGGFQPIGTTDAQAAIATSVLAAPLGAGAVVGAIGGIGTTAIGIYGFGLSSTFAPVGSTVATSLVAGGVTQVGGLTVAGGGIGTAITSTAIVGGGVGGGFVVGAGVGGVYNKDGSRNANYNPSAFQRPNVPNPAAPTPGSNPNDLNRPGSTPLPSFTNPNAPTGPRAADFYVSVGKGRQQTNVNRTVASGVKDVAPITGGGGQLPGQIGGGGSPAPPPTQTPNTPNNKPPGTGTTKPQETKNQAPPGTTRDNPIDTTYYNESQREQLNESIETFYEDYAERLGDGAAVFHTFIGSPGVSYGLIDSSATTLEAGGHTHTTSGTMDETGGGGTMGLLQPAFACMWIIKT